MVKPATAPATTPPQRHFAAARAAPSDASETDRSGMNSTVTTIATTSTTPRNCTDIRAPLYQPTDTRQLDANLRLCQIGNTTMHSENVLRGPDCPPETARVTSSDGRAGIDAALVKRLVKAQFPQWAELVVEPVRVEGWDNRTYRLGDSMTVRLPTAAAYAPAVDKEDRWLPVLAPQLPVAVPEVLG